MHNQIKMRRYTKLITITYYFCVSNFDKLFISLFFLLLNGFANYVLPIKKT